MSDARSDLEELTEGGGFGIRVCGIGSTRREMRVVRRNKGEKGQKMGFFEFLEKRPNQSTTSV